MRTMILNLGSLFSTRFRILRISKLSQLSGCPGKGETVERLLSLCILIQEACVTLPDGVLLEKLKVCQMCSKGNFSIDA